ncbi:MAG TPA: dolichyl-phosphate beta-glucosyltransferase [Vicinamibacteria bacterium]|nr:dolichyl-phosphate beta-glucosyltransferase [Vicinamibacteria bacterium]
MPATPELSLVVPAFNEVRTITETLQSIRRHLDGRALTHEVIVAADGDDGTREAAGALAAGDGRITVLGARERAGKGRAIRQAVARARGRTVGFVDADLKTPIEELEKLLPWLEEGYDVVIGSRAMSDSRIERQPPALRRAASRALRLLTRFLIGLQGIRDTQCGLKLFKGEAARDLFSRQRIDGYMFDVEVLHLALRLGYRVKEVGVRWRADRDSRLDPLAGNGRNVLDLLRIRFSGPSAS